MLISTVAMASVERLPRFLCLLGDKLVIAPSIVALAVPAVLLGAQLGSRVARHVPQQVLERGQGVLFILIGALTLEEVIL